MSMMYKRWGLVILLSGAILALAACGQESAAVNAAEPLMKFDGGTVVYSDIEILCH
jgi:hypothetical protein